MVFSALLGEKSAFPRLKQNARSSSNPTATATLKTKCTVPQALPEHANYISEESQLGDPTDDECPDLRELNHSLDALAVVFPDIQIEVFREMLSSFDGESRLALVADALLKNRVTWVKGRWKVAERDEKKEQTTSTTQVGPASSSSLSPVQRPERFRSPAYKEAVKALAWHEFKPLSKSTINAVLAEHNYWYLDARQTLVTLSSKSWRCTISSIFSRRPRPVTSAEAKTHPLVVWKSTGKGSIMPTLRATGCPELDRDLFDVLVRPLRELARLEQQGRDKELAQFLNNEEAAETDATHECCCCFIDGAFEEFTSCNASGHLICYRCVQHSLSEAVFGQGWHSIDSATGTLKCMAVDGGECPGHITVDHLERAILDMPKGEDVLLRFEHRLAEQNLVAANVPLLRCPFCSYAEIDDIYLPEGTPALQVRVGNIIDFFVVLFIASLIPFALPVLLIVTALYFLLMGRATNPGTYLQTEWREAIKRHRRRRRGAKFACLNPLCLRPSCLSCQKAWVDVHVCHESSLVSLRTQVEHAMSMAVKRVCPRCNTSFVKNAGCNKLRCPCGYRMCYVCRRDIGDEGYRHFCDHFRAAGDGRQCRECDRCNLWENEDTDDVLRKAKADAEKRWMEREERELSGSERAFLETGVAVAGTGGPKSRSRSLFSLRKVPSVPEVFDVLSEMLFY